MIITRREKLQLDGKKIKTCGSYNFDKEDRSAYCKCSPLDKIGEWPNSCKRCYRRIRI